MHRGDVLLFHRETSLEGFRKDFLGTLFTTLIHLCTQSRWNHTAIALDDKSYIEATSLGVCVTPMPESTRSTGDEIVVVHVPYDDEDDEIDAVAWAAGRVGVRYGYFNAFMCGLRHVFPGVTIKFGDSVICSELVAEALERAGYDFDKDSVEVSPGDVAEELGVPR